MPQFGAELNVYICVDHDSHYIGGASVIVAGSEDEARELLKKELQASGLDDRRPFTIKRIDTQKPQAVILRDGDY